MLEERRLAIWNHDEDGTKVTLYDNGMVEYVDNGHPVPKSKHGLGFTVGYAIERDAQQLINIIAETLGPRFIKERTS